LKITKHFTTDYLLKQDCSLTRQRHRDYWHHVPLDTPLLHIKVKRTTNHHKLPTDQNKSRKEFELDLPWHINHCRDQVMAYDFLFDSMPLAVVMFGRDITNMGVLSGNDFSIHLDSEFITFKKSADFLFTPTPQFKQEMPFVKEVLAIYQGIHEDIAKLACLNPPTTADAMTTMAMIMGMESFLRSLRKQPDAVKQKAIRLNKLFYSFYDYIYQYLLDSGYGESASWFPVFAEGKFDSIRSDVSVMLSENMFNEFSLPVICNACSYLDYTMFNLDSVELIRFLPALSKIERLNGIYWNIEPQLRNINEFLPVLGQIKESGLLLALPCKDVPDAILAMNELGRSSLLLEFPVFEDKNSATSAGEEVMNFARHCLY
jgi:hypothetical protein